MTSSEYKIRTVIILALLLTWAAFAAAKVYTFTVRDRQVLLIRSHPIAWRTAEIPARRGRILDRDGAVLAEDVFRCDLILYRHPEKNRRHHLQRRLDEAIPGAELPPETAEVPAVLRKDLTAEEIFNIIDAIRNKPAPEIGRDLEEVRKEYFEVQPNKFRKPVSSSKRPKFSKTMDSSSTPPNPATPSVATQSLRRPSTSFTPSRSP